MSEFKINSDTIDQIIDYFFDDNYKYIDVNKLRVILHDTIIKIVDNTNTTIFKPKDLRSDYIDYLKTPRVSGILKDLSQLITDEIIEVITPMHMGITDNEVKYNVDIMVHQGLSDMMHDNYLNTSHVTEKKTNKGLTKSESGIKELKLGSLREIGSPRNEGIRELRLGSLQSKPESEGIKELRLGSLQSKTPLESNVSQATKTIQLGSLENRSPRHQSTIETASRGEYLPYRRLY